MIIKNFFIISLLWVFFCSLHAVPSRARVAESAVVGALGTTGLLSSMALRASNSVVRFAGVMGMIGVAVGTTNALTFFTLTRGE